MNTTEAVKQVALASGIGTRSLYVYRRATNFIPRAEWAKVLSRPPRRDRLGLQVDCHPQALETFLHLCRHGVVIAESYRCTQAEAELKGWLPLPSERTLRRELVRRVDPEEMRRARRNATV